LLNKLKRNNKRFNEIMRANEQIGHNIKRWREFKEVKQEQLAKRLKITSAALSQLENGKTDITVSRIEQIAEVLDIDFSLLLSSPQQIINISNSPNTHNGVYNSQHNTINKELVEAVQAELQKKKEQNSFLQNLVQPKQ
jgi:transcriptional regulator with XRE-family HTH domain